MTQRTERIDQLLREEITAILAKEVADPEIGFVTVTDVETAPDLRHARVWVSVIGQRGERDVTLRALERAMVYVRRVLGTRLRIKRIPELHIRLDESAERGTRVLRLLDELEAGQTPDELPGDSLPTPTARIGHVGDGPAEPGAADVTAARGPRRRRQPWRPPTTTRGRSTVHRRTR
jgi:ribosome-binding factor A